MSSTPEIDIDQLATSGPSGTVVDVREPHEYISGHVPGAALISKEHLAGRLQELDRARPVFVICATGNRSRAMTDLLRGAGFDAYSVAGGTAAWCRSGRPVDGGLE